MKLSKPVFIGLTIFASVFFFTGLSIIFLKHQLLLEQQRIDQKWTEVDQLYGSKLQILQEVTQEIDPILGISEREILMNVINSINEYGSSGQTKDRVKAAGFVEAAEDRLRKTQETYPQIKTAKVQDYFDQITQQEQEFEPARATYNQMVDTYNQRLTQQPYKKVVELFDIQPENRFDLTAQTPQLANVELPAETPGLASAAPIELLLPSREGFVNDVADILPPSFEQKLETQLSTTASVGNRTEVVVVTIPSLQEMPVELVTDYFMDRWRIGQNYQQKGVLFLISVNDQVIRITPTEALAEEITPERATTIINHQVASAFESEKHLQGIQDGVDSVLLLVDDSSTVNLPITRVSTTSFDQVLMPFLSLLMVYAMTLIGFLVFFYVLTKKTPAWAAIIFAGLFGFIVGQFQGVGLLTGLLFSAIAAFYTFGFKWLKY